MRTEEQIINDFNMRLIKNGMVQEGKVNTWVLSEFEQLWGSTAIGLGDFGGQAMTFATTTIVLNKETKKAGVYFNGTFAYMVSILNNPEFIEDLIAQDMKSVTESKTYFK